MFYWIYDIPGWLAVLLFVAVFVVFNTVGVVVLRPYLRKLIDDLADDNSLITNVLQLYTVMFGLLMGTLAVVTYQNLSAAQQIVDDEATSIAAMYRDAQNYPAPVNERLEAAIKDYTLFVINEAWPLQRQGLLPKGGINRADAIQGILYTFEPQTQGQLAMHQETLRQYNTFIVKRRARLGAVQGAIPPILWWTMASGSMLLMALMWLFHTQRRALLLLSGVTAFALGSMTGLIALMDNPFRGELGVSPAPYQLVVEDLMTPK